MNDSLAATLETTLRSERRTALRHLLRNPFVAVRNAAETFSLIVRHRRWLVDWFADNPGWQLSVDPAAGTARLFKIPWRADATRPARLSRKPPFDRRRYALFCLTLAALDSSPAQTTLARLAELVAESSADEPEVRRFDPDVYGERRAFVDALRLLLDLGVLTLRDGDTDRYAQNREADALYDVNDRALGQLVASPIPPTLAEEPSRMLRETYPDTEEGRRTRARHQAFRALLEDPAVYYADLEESVHEWLDHSRGFVYRVLEEEVGFQVERRREGLAAVDELGEVTDESFPAAGSTVKHVALLLAEQFTSRGREEPDRRFAAQECVQLTETLIEDYGERCNWSAIYVAEEGGAGRLAEEAMQLLAAFCLVHKDGDDWIARPAIARFAPAPVSAGG